MLYEVHKFSKFIHGCATLLPEDVQAVPYWVDDASLVESIIASGAKVRMVRNWIGHVPSSNTFLCYASLIVAHFNLC